MVFGNRGRYSASQMGPLMSATYLLLGAFLLSMLIWLPFGMYHDYQLAKAQYPNATLWQRLNLPITRKP